MGCRIRAIALVCGLMGLLGSQAALAAPNPAKLQLKSGSALVMDINTGKTLYQKNPAQQLRKLKLYEAHHGRAVSRNQRKLLSSSSLDLSCCGHSTNIVSILNLTHKKLRIPMMHGDFYVRWSPVRTKL